VNYKGVPISGKAQENGFHKLKLSRDSVNGSIKYSMRKREGEIDHKEASNKKDLITRKNSR
jgi:hypothetical protein